ncbi:lipopolysaccharide export system permease protein [Pacificibacter maritimus]|uniref:Lipopolysaccharide export system permease protein n=1 Tax=Pacificibacter maritimus TaxID=762213 RepID=A0A3N4UNM2_9RHOB|nr:LPS export ABC transporter permease LptG [Pacificibacter maritimus]RPE71618.1 lipopolysaccharide export system permease protein [Pacificibacter maritimus]
MILHLYFARRALSAIATVVGILVVLILMIEMLEQIRKFGSAEISFGQIVYLAILRVPETLHAVLPVIIVIATLILFLGLSRSSELVVTRAAGRSAMRSLCAPLSVAFIIGMLAVAILNPLVSSSSRKFDQLKAQYLDEQTQVFSVSDEGLWLRQGNADGQVVIRASQANFDGSQLFNVTFLGFDTGGSPSFRIEANIAELTPSQWNMSAVKYWDLQNSLNPEANAVLYDNYSLPTTLTLDEIQDTFGTPAAVPIWEMRAFIQRLEKAGFSARAYKMWFQSELALPLTLVAMMLIGAGFTMRHTRFGSTGRLVTTALLLAFAFFFLRNFANILGQNGEIPIILAAWAPPIAVIFASLAFLLHIEDG